MKRVLFMIVATTSIAASIGATGCATTAKVSTSPGIAIETSFARKDYVVLGTARGEACATESCIFGACTPKADVAGEELLDGRMETENIRDVNIGRASFGPFEALYELFFGTPGPNAGQVAENIALYKAIESVPNADAIITPRKTIDIHKNDILGLVVTTKSCVKVAGKAVHIKSDAEIAKKKPATPGTPTSPPPPATSTSPAPLTPDATSPTPTTTTPTPTPTTTP
jgi:hypothetical protein